ncbi:MAG: sortase [Anaerolineae bacterium]|nr:sortase [Anaerolineae bacterium]MBT7075390.1 sortase [Anaerolineae bacterium]
MVNFTVQAESAPSTLPSTGFQHGRVTALPKQPAAKAYAETEMLLEIPKLDVSMPIVGVPQSDSGWDVTWLNNSAGYLVGSAFPTWAGNTVITAHVWDVHNQPGIFSDLKTLGYGDQVQIQAWGQTYTYEVRESKLVTTKNVNAVLQSSDYDWLTLVTCEFYNPFTGDYLFRRAVRAVLVSVK